MKKDVIYIDIEDDVTSIIEKLKNSKEKIVALVPPKGNSVLQSVVNLKLIKRAANTAGKQPVVVTSNHALTALAGGLDLYVAKNLQSKPVLASTLANEVPDDESVEVSDEVGELDAAPKATSAGNDDDEVELDGEELIALEAADKAEAAEPKLKKAGHGKSKKVPNFDTFRKKLLIGGGIAVLLLIAGLFVFGRAKANIVVRAETTPVDVALEAKLNANTAQSDPATANLKAVSQEKKQTISQNFSATGQKDIGEKATGIVRFSTGSISALGTTIPAGTQIVSGGLAFVTTESVTITISNYSGANSGIAAAESGIKYNGASGNASGAPSGISAQITKATTGGTTQIVKVVTQDDINKARAQLEQKDSNAVKEELKKAFSAGAKVLDDSLVVSIGSVTSEPAANQPANDAKLTAEVTYSLLAVSEEDLGETLDSFVTSKMTNKDQQRVYQNGLKDAKFEKVAADAKTATYKITAIGQYGPQFDTEKLKEEVTGKKFGEVRSYLQDLPGVKGVDIKLTPFWARKIPGVNRIDIKLDVANNNGG